MSGVEKAAQKGAKESLVMVDDVALVVSIKNKTVITAVDKSALKTTSSLILIVPSSFRSKGISKQTKD